MISSAEPNTKPLVGGESSPVRRDIGVLAIDAVPLFKAGLSALIARTPGLRLLGTTGNLHAAVALCTRVQPDVALIDAVLDPRCHLGKLLAGVARSVGVLSVVREPLRTAEYLAAATAAGIPGLVLRSAEPSRIVTAIQRTNVEGRYLDPDLGPLIDSSLARRWGTGRQPLSRREYQVLQLISDGLENHEIAKELLVSVETIRTHVKTILRKLQAKDRAHAVSMAFRLGVLVAHHSTPRGLASPGPERVAPTGRAGRTAQPTHKHDAR